MSHDPAKGDLNDVMRFCFISLILHLFHLSFHRESPQQAEEVPKFQFLKLFLRRMFFFGIAITLAYVFSKRDTNIVFVNSTEKISRRSHQVPCSSDYTNDSIRWPGKEYRHSKPHTRLWSWFS